MNTQSYAKGISAWWGMISRMGPVYSHAPPVNDFEQEISGKAELARPRPASLRVREAAGRPSPVSAGIS